MFKQRFATFGNKQVTRSHAQGCAQHPIVNASKPEQASLSKSVLIIGSVSAGPEANIISSHKIYNLKINDNQSQVLKARIAPHCNEYNNKFQFCFNCCMPPPVGIRVILNGAAILRWRIV